MSLRKSLIGILCAAICAPVLSAEVDNGIRAFNQQEMTEILDKYFAGIASERLKGFSLAAGAVVANGRRFYYTWARANPSRGTMTVVLHSGSFNPLDAPEAHFNRKTLITYIEEFYVDCSKRRFLQIGGHNYGGKSLFAIQTPIEAEFDPANKWQLLKDSVYVELAADTVACKNFIQQAIP